MSEVQQTTGDEWTPEACERLLALIAIPDPKWYRPLMWFLTYVPIVNALPTQKLRRKMDRYQTTRAIRIYRERGR